MLNKKFELVIVLDGTIESTGQNTNAKTSYLANEILWGQKFRNMLYYNDELECYEANYKLFDKLKSVPLPLCSAASYEDFKNGKYLVIKIFKNCFVDIVLVSYYSKIT